MNVLLIEDHPAARAAIADGLTRQGLDVTAVGTVQAARDVVDHATIHIALVDLRLDGESGLDAISLLTARNIPCIALTNSADAVSLGQAFRRGARGYLLKDDPVRDVAAAIRGALAGGLPLSPAMTHHLIQPLQAPPNAMPYTLTVALHEPRAVLAHTTDAVEVTFRSRAQVSLLFALAERWSSDGAGEGRGWLDDDALTKAVWGARRREHVPNNLNVLIFRVRAQAADVGIDKQFIEKQPGETRLNVAQVFFG